MKTWSIDRSSNMSDDLSKFTQSVKEIFEVQDQMRAIAAEAREKKSPLKERADSLEGEIREYMTKAEIEVCNYHDERLELKTVTRFGSLTKKSLQGALAVYFQDEGKAQECFDSIMGTIGSNEITVLKRLKNRKRKAAGAPEGEASSKRPNFEAPPELSDDDEEED